MKQKCLFNYYLTVITVGSLMMVSMAFAAKQVIVLPLDDKMYVVPFGNSLPPDVRTVTSAGQTWMDRNLGASQVAVSYDDSLAYGDLYQWGRLRDGHEKRNSRTTSVLSSSDTPGHGYFIKSSSFPFDWRSSQKNELWQGESGTNNPCPAGFRLPTHTELNVERNSWSSYYTAGAFASPLKLVLAGGRTWESGTLLYAGGAGYYWSSTVVDSRVYDLGFGNTFSGVYSHSRAYGFSVRCLKD